MNDFPRLPYELLQLGRQGFGVLIRSFADRRESVTFRVHR